MKKKNGLMFTLLTVALTLSSFVSAEPTTKTPLGENTFSTLIAQNENPDYVDQTKTDSVVTNVIQSVTTVLPLIKIDTVENVQDIVDSGVYLVKSVHRGMTWQEILYLIFGVIGLALGIYYFVRHKKLKDLMKPNQGSGSRVSNY